MASIPHPLLGILRNSGQLEWMDLLLVPAACLVFLAGLIVFPRLFARPFFWLLTHTVYKLRAYEVGKLPASGPALIVCNHVSYVDWLFLWMASPRRLRFVGWAGFSKFRLLRYVFRIADVIPIDGNAGPKAVLRTLKTIAEALDRGEAVVIFPESTLTRNGVMLPFRHGIERILKYAKRDVPVIPVHLSQVWGSIFSYKGGKLFRKWPQQLPYPVSVTFGDPLPKGTSAPEARQAIQLLSAEVAIRERDHLLAPHRYFVRQAARFRVMRRPCLIDTSTPEPRTLNFLKTLVACMCLSKWLRDRVGTHDKVGVWLPSSTGCALANVCLAFLGRTTVNLNYTAGAEANRSAARQTGITHIVTSRKFITRMPIELDESIQRVFLEDATAGISKWTRISSLLKALLLPGWFLDRFVLGLGKHKSDDLATIIFSSGSTGEPKGVMLSNGNIAANAAAFIARVGIEPTDRMLGILPLFHSFGYTVTLWAPLIVGCSVVYYPDPRQAQEIGQICKAQKCSMMLGTATFLRFFIRRCEPDDFKSLRFLVCGAERLPPSVAEEFEKKFGILPLEGYGCTELSPVVSVNLPDTELYGVTQQSTRIGTIGLPIPGVAARIVDPDTDKPLPLNHEGLLLIKGPNVMVGYWGKPELTAKAIRNGWYVTGDMGRIDDDGFITLTGRISRFAKIAGEMIPLEKLEEEMHTALGTADRVVAVSSIPDERKGERLIVLHLPTLAMPKKELLEKVAATGMPNLWVPATRDFFEIQEMPVLGTGKLDLKRLKEIAAEVVKRD